MALIENEIVDGFVVEFLGSEEDARKEWPTGVAKGRLGIAKSEGHADRLLLDTTISGVNPMTIIPEKTMVPGPYDVRHHIQPDPSKERVALVVDVSKAHKRVKLAKADRGLMLFEAANRLLEYAVCHFGGAFSDYWWKRVAALITDVTHLLLWVAHGGRVYVDDWRLLFASGFWYFASLSGCGYFCCFGSTFELGQTSLGATSVVAWTYT